MKVTGGPYHYYASAKVAIHCAPPLMLFTLACGLAPLAKHRVSRASLATGRRQPVLHHGKAQNPACQVSRPECGRPLCY
jgi:hypothetical protein